MYDKMSLKVIDGTPTAISEYLREIETQEDKRFVIQTSNIENDKYLGGYFYS